jgi:hypothetical protein
MKYLVLVFITILFGVSLRAQQLTDSLLIYYPFNGNSQDQSGNSYNGFVNGATLCQDQYGANASAYSFDGVNDYIELPNNPTLKPNFPITISFRAKVNSLSQVANKFIATDQNVDSYCGIWITTSGDGMGKISANYGGNTGGCNPYDRRTKVSDSTIQVGIWHQIVCVFRGVNDMDIYIDCVNAGGSYSGTGSPNIAYSNNAGRIGCEPNTSQVGMKYFDGSMDEFAYWNRALSATDVMRLCEGEPLSVSENHARGVSVLAYPNPSNGLFTIEIPENEISSQSMIDIYDAYGRLLKTADISATLTDIDLSDFPAGMYIYHFRNEKNNSFSKGKLTLL